MLCTVSVMSQNKEFAWRTTCSQYKLMLLVLSRNFGDPKIHIYMNSIIYYGLKKSTALFLLGVYYDRIILLLYLCTEQSYYTFTTWRSIEPSSTVISSKSSIRPRRLLCSPAFCTTTSQPRLTSLQMVRVLLDIRLFQNTHICVHSDQQKQAKYLFFNTMLYPRP